MAEPLLWQHRAGWPYCEATPHDTPRPRGAMAPRGRLEDHDRSWASPWPWSWTTGRLEDHDRSWASPWPPDHGNPRRPRCSTTPSVETRGSPRARQPRYMETSGAPVRGNQRQPPTVETPTVETCNFRYVHFPLFSYA